MYPDWKEWLASGIPELYVLGLTSDEESAEAQRMCQRYPEVAAALDVLEKALIAYSTADAPALDPTLKPFLMATIDYMERMEQGEQPAFPPELHEGSTIATYRQWLDRGDLALKGPLHQIDARIIGYTPQMTTAIIWLEFGAPPETHTDEHEKFLIVDGTCNIIVDGKDNHLKPGDYFAIPLFSTHAVMVTSGPCRVILQRVAA